LKIFLGIMKKKKPYKTKIKINYIKFVEDKPGHDEKYAPHTDFFKKNIKLQNFKRASMTGLKETVDLDF
jgi:dTDP-D-glucose 4,6-dehydratase